jgi:hypothetical protein
LGLASRTEDSTNRGLNDRLLHVSYEPAIYRIGIELVTGSQEMVSRCGPLPTIRIGEIGRNWWLAVSSISECRHSDDHLEGASWQLIRSASP